MEIVTTIAPIALALIMLGLGASLTVKDFTRVFQNPKEIIVDRTTPANQRNSILDESTHNIIIDIALSLLLDRVKEQEIRNIESLRDLE